MRFTSALVAAALAAPTVMAVGAEDYTELDHTSDKIDYDASWANQGKRQSSIISSVAPFGSKSHSCTLLFDRAFHCEDERLVNATLGGTELLADSLRMTVSLAVTNQTNPGGTAKFQFSGKEFWIFGPTGTHFGNFSVSFGAKVISPRRPILSRCFCCSQVVTNHGQSTTAVSSSSAASYV